MRDSNRWTRCSGGHRHWGSLGAAGLLLCRRGTDDDEIERVEILLQHRAEWVHHGNTWSVPGGAIHPRESAWDAALREVMEETGLDLSQAHELTRHVDDHGGWSYTTIVARVYGGAPPPETIVLGEQQNLTWVAVEDVHTLALHPGFADTWPAVRSMVSSLTR